jgi:hypothetical protein
MKKLVFGAILLAAAAPALASNWVLVGTNTYGSTYEIDRETLNRDGSSVTFWLKVHYGATAPKGESDGYVARRKVNCGDRSYQDLQTDYQKDGKVIQTSGVEEMRFAAPDSIAASVVSNACSG